MYRAYTLNRNIESDLCSRAGVTTENRWTLNSYRGKRTQPKRLDRVSMRDPSLNLPQGGEIDNRLRITQPHSQAPPE
jgi:hypothetical protein